MEENRDFRIDQEVDQYDLDNEFIKQPGLYYYWNREWQKAALLFKRLDLEKKVIKAKLYKKYKDQVQVSGKPLTDTGVDAAVHDDPEYRDVSERLIDAEYQMNVLEGAKWAMVSREKTLLYLAETRMYQPKDGSDTGGEIRQQRDCAVKRKTEERRNIQKDQEEHLRGLLPGKTETKIER